VGKIEILQENEADTFFHGAAVVFNTSTSVDDDHTVPASTNGNPELPEKPMLTEDLLPILIGITAGVVIVLGLSLLIYKKRKRRNT
jgi:LPXTG-motif cell wall-anchored protein